MSGRLSFVFRNRPPQQQWIQLIMISANAFVALRLFLLLLGLVRGWPAGVWLVFAFGGSLYLPIAGIAADYLSGLNQSKRADRLPVGISPFSGCLRHMAFRGESGSTGGLLAPTA